MGLYRDADGRLAFSMSGPCTSEQVERVNTVGETIGLQGYFDALVGWWRGPDNMPVNVPLLKAIECAFEMGRSVGQADLRDMEALKDGAYLERNRCVALIARMALASGWRAGTARTAIEGWSADWHGCVYVDLPTGQVSWHYHDSQADLFADLPPYTAPWDGHDTPEKYRRVATVFPGGVPVAIVPAVSDLAVTVGFERWARGPAPADWWALTEAGKCKAAYAQGVRDAAALALISEP